MAQHLTGTAAAIVLLTAILAPASTLAQESPEPAAADRIYMNDGSRLVGQLVRWRDGELQLKTQTVGDVTLSAEQVQGISTGEQVRVELTTGERVIGQLLYDEADDVQQVVGTAFGDVATDAPSIAGIWRTGDPEPETVVQQELREEQEQQVMTIREDYETQLEQLRETQPALGNNWTARLELGASGATGNVESFGITGRASAKRETEYDRLFLNVGGRYERSEGEDVAENVFGGATLEVDINENLFTYLSAKLERDEFEALEIRSVVTGGLGYFVFREDDHELKLRGGTGFQYESFRDGTSESDIVLELGVDYRADIQTWLTFTHSTTLYPSVEDFASDYRVISETAGEIPIGGTEAWKLRAGMRNKYNAMPRPGIDRLDTTYFLNMVYDWK